MIFYLVIGLLLGFFAYRLLASTAMNATSTETTSKKKKRRKRVRKSAQNEQEPTTDSSKPVQKQQTSQASSHSVVEEQDQSTHKKPAIIRLVPSDPKPQKPFHPRAPKPEPLTKKQRENMRKREVQKQLKAESDVQQEQRLKEHRLNQYRYKTSSSGI